MGLVILCYELAIMFVRVTGLALCRGAFESGLLVRRWFVAIGARNRTMCAEQRVVRFRMVEAIDIGPRLHVVASFAAERSAVGPFVRHLLVKLPFVRVLMAGGATPVFEMEGRYLVSRPTQPNFVAIGAGNCNVRSLQRKAQTLVLCNGEAGAVPILEGVAILAAVVVGGLGKLIFVRVFVAIRACREFHFVESIFASGNVALCALYFGMLTS